MRGSRSIHVDEDPARESHRKAGKYAAWLLPGYVVYVGRTDGGSDASRETVQEEHFATKSFWTTSCQRKALSVICGAKQLQSLQWGNPGSYVNVHGSEEIRISMQLQFLLTCPIMARKRQDVLVNPGCG